MQKKNERKQTNKLPRSTPLPTHSLHPRSLPLRAQSRLRRCHRAPSRCARRFCCLCLRTLLPWSRLGARMPQASTWPPRFSATCASPWQSCTACRGPALGSSAAIRAKTFGSALGAGAWVLYITKLWRMGLFVFYTWLQQEMNAIIEKSQ